MAPILSYARPHQTPQPLTPAPALAAFLGAPLLIVGTQVAYAFYPDSAILICSASEFLAVTTLFTTILFLANRIRYSQTADAAFYYSLQVVFTIFIWFPTLLFLFFIPGRARE